MSDKMTIAQALRRIKKLKGQIAEHTQRARDGVSYVSTKVPVFRFADEVAAMKAAQDEMVDLDSRLAIANAMTFVKDGQVSLVLAKAIRVLQELKGEIAFLKSLFLRSETVREKEQSWSDETGKYTTTINDVVYVSDLSEKDRERQVRELQDRFEALNNAVEDANHTVLV